MNKISIILSSILSVGLVACGGDSGSGLSDSKVVGTLTLSEAMDLCVELSESFPERTVDCGGGVTLTVGINPAECTDQPPATCTATVGNFRDCFDAFGDLSDAELCSDTTLPPAACAPVLSAECSGA